MRETARGGGLGGGRGEGDAALPALVGPEPERGVGGDVGFEAGGVGGCQGVGGGLRCVGREEADFDAVVAAGGLGEAPVDHRGGHTGCHGSGAGDECRRVVEEHSDVARVAVARFLVAHKASHRGFALLAQAEQVEEGDLLGYRPGAEP